MDTYSKSKYASVINQRGGWDFLQRLLAALAAGVSAAACAGGSREERAVIMVKPDGVQRGHVAEILGRFERRGFVVVAARVVVPSRELAAQHYAEHAGKPFFPKLVAFLSSGPVFAFVIEGKGAVDCGRAMLGEFSCVLGRPVEAENVLETNQPTN